MFIVKRFRFCSACLPGFPSSISKTTVFFGLAGEASRQLKRAFSPVLGPFFCFFPMLCSLANRCNSRFLAMAGLPSGHSVASHRRCRRFLFGPFLFGPLHSSILKEDGVV